VLQSRLLYFDYLFVFYAVDFSSIEFIPNSIRF